MPKEDYIPVCEYTISKLEDSLEKRPAFISISFCHDGDTYVNLSYDEDENKGE